MRYMEVNVYKGSSMPMIAWHVLMAATSIPEADEEIDLLIYLD